MWGVERQIVNGDEVTSAQNVNGDEVTLSSGC